MIQARPPVAQPAKGHGGDDAEAPLDPAIERIRLRLRRLLLISSATMMVGFLAVLAAVIYKIGPGRSKPVLAPEAAERVVAGVLPPGGHVVGASLDGTLLAVTVEAADGTRIVVIDLSSGGVVRRLSLGSQ